MDPLQKEREGDKIIQISTRKLDSVRRRLESQGVAVSGYTEDFYTHRRCMTLEAPDGVKLIISE